MAGIHQAKHNALAANARARCARVQSALTKGGGEVKYMYTHMTFSHVRFASTQNEKKAAMLSAGVHVCARYLSNNHARVCARADDSWRLSA
jgi:hypothetical protein